MPTGVYQVGTGGREAFSCAAGPLGWRYVSGRADLVCDRAGLLRLRTPDLTVARIRLDDGHPVLRVEPADGGPGWHLPAEHAVTDSVGTWVALARLVAGPGADPVSRTVQVWAAGPAQVASWTVARVGATTREQGGAEALVEEWQICSGTSEPSRVVLVGDVLVWSAPLPHLGTVEVLHLDGPPTGVP